jgi:uncharacterized membrane protein YeaQ/YmgE (transglycosylase-associated protein family)
VADILLGISGAFLVRCITELLHFPLDYVNLLLVSVWGAAAPPVIVRLILRRRRSKAGPRKTTVAVL